MAEELVKHEKTPIEMTKWGVKLTTFEDCYRFATVVFKGGFAPKNLENPEAVAIAIQYGMEVGLSAMQAIQNVAPINNKPAIYGDAALGLVMSKDILEDFEECFTGTFPNDDCTAVCRAKRKGVPTEFRYTFSVADARRAKLWNKPGPWTQYPQRMLQMRARGFLLRNAAPDALKGLITVEEAWDYPKKEATRDAEMSVKDIFEPAPQKPPGAPQTPVAATSTHSIAPVPGTPEEAKELLRGTAEDVVVAKPDLGHFYDEIKAYVEELAKYGRAPDLDLAVVCLMDDSQQQEELLKLQKVYEEVMKAQ